MRYLCSDEPSKPESNAPPSKLEARATAGVLLSTEGCRSSARGARRIAAFGLVSVSSKGEAIEWTKRFFKVAGEAEREIRLLDEAAPSAS